VELHAKGLCGLSGVHPTPVAKPLDAIFAGTGGRLRRETRRTVIGGLVC